MCVVGRVAGCVVGCEMGCAVGCAAGCALGCVAGWEEGCLVVCVVGCGEAALGVMEAAEGGAARVAGAFALAVSGSAMSSSLAFFQASLDEGLGCLAAVVCRLSDEQKASVGKGCSDGKEGGGL